MNILCEGCFKRYYASVIRECPRKPGHYICMYCCGKCKRRYAAEPGYGCTAFDEGNAEKNDGDGGGKQ